MPQFPDTTIIARDTDRLIRVVLPDGSGVVEIRTDLATADGRARMRVDVVSDFPCFGRDHKGRAWEVTGGDPGPGVVFLTADTDDERAALVRRARLAGVSLAPEDIEAGEEGLTVDGMPAGDWLAAVTQD